MGLRKPADQRRPVLNDAALCRDWPPPEAAAGRRRERLPLPAGLADDFDADADWPPPDFWAPDFGALAGLPPRRPRDRFRPPPLPWGRWPPCGFAGASTTRPPGTTTRSPG